MMGIILYSRFDKKKISGLPRVTFPGEIIVVETPETADSAVDDLLRSGILGVDTETRPSFKKGVVHKVALLQVATHDKCYLFRLNKIGITESIKKLLEDKTIPKVGLSLHDDFTMLRRRSKFTPGYFIDLQNLVPELGVRDMSLQKLYANVFGKRIAKKEQLSNWENKQLTPKQQLYASTDAWTCINLFERINELRQTHNYRLINNEPLPTADNGTPEQCSNGITTEE